MKLPPVSEYGKYRLPDGSIIYPSYKPGKFFLWIFLGYEESKGIMVQHGRIVMGKSDLLYFNNPAQAYQEWEIICLENSSSQSKKDSLTPPNSPPVK